MPSDVLSIAEVGPSAQQQQQPQERPTGSSTSAPALDLAALAQAVLPFLSGALIGPASAPVRLTIDAGSCARPPSPPLPAQPIEPTPASPQPWYSSPGAPWGAPAGAFPGYAGPLTNNPAAGASPFLSLLHQFPEVEDAVLLAIIRHEFKGPELYKLDPVYPPRGVLQWENVNGCLQLKAEPLVKDYPTLVSLHTPLVTYFQVLIQHAGPTGKAGEVANCLLSYLQSLTTLSTEYEWHAVLAYHMAFFARRRREMCDGNYAGWKQIDIELHMEQLSRYRKPDHSSSAHLPPRRRITPRRRAKPVHPVVPEV